jgi:hypothetical protein
MTKQDFELLAVALRESKPTDPQTTERADGVQRVRGGGQRGHTSARLPREGQGMSARSVWFLYLMAVTVLVAVVLAGIGGRATLPRCQEDAVLIGRGDFDDGRWSAYECGPAVDDFAP